MYNVYHKNKLIIQLDKITTRAGKEQFIKDNTKQRAKLSKESSHEISVTRGNWRRAGKNNLIIQYKQ